MAPCAGHRDAGRTLKCGPPCYSWRPFTSLPVEVFYQAEHQHLLEQAFSFGVPSVVKE